MKRIVGENEDFKITDLLEAMKKGDEILIPFEEKRHHTIKTISFNMNRRLRDKRVLKSEGDLKYRVLKKTNPGYTTIYCLK